MSLESPSFHDVYDPEAKPDLARSRALLFPGVIRGKMPKEEGILDFDNRLPNGYPTFIPHRTIGFEEMPEQASETSEVIS